MLRDLGRRRLNVGPVPEGDARKTSLPHMEQYLIISILTAQVFYASQLL